MNGIEMSPKSHKTPANRFNRKIQVRQVYFLLPLRQFTLGSPVFQPEAHLHVFQAWWQRDSTLVPLGGPGSAPRPLTPGGTAQEPLPYISHCVSPGLRKSPLLGTQKLAPQLPPNHAAPPLLVRSGRDLGESCLMLYLGEGGQTGPRVTKPVSRKMGA